MELEVGIVCSDIEALLAFYEAALGFERTTVVDADVGLVHKLRRGSARVKLFRPVRAPDPAPEVESWSSRSGRGYAALYLDDLAELAETVERCRDLGATVLIEPAQHRPNARMALVADLEANVWELLWEDPDPKEAP